MDDMGHCARPEATGVALTNTSDAGVGGNFHKNPIAPSPTGSRWRCDYDFEVLKLHKGLRIMIQLNGRSLGFMLVALRLPKVRVLLHAKGAVI